MKLAPIAMFVYNRLDHTKRTIDALLQNDLAENSILYIFSDGQKNEADRLHIDLVRAYVKTIQGFKDIILFERPTNVGLASNIVAGVTEVLKSNESIIVLEDDILASKGFLRFMNDSLILYENSLKVGCIHGWNYSFSSNKSLNSTFFLKGADCWGWATWKRAWKFYNNDGQELLNLIKASNSEFEFNRRDTHQYISMLEDQIKGLNNSWAIRWHASLFIHDMYCLHPTNPIVKNIGLDNSGTHCGLYSIEQNPVEYIQVNLQEIIESEWFYSEFFKYTLENKKKNKWMFIKKQLRKLFPLS